MQSELHKDLVKTGSKWLRKQGFSVVASELKAVGARETPDVIGFRSTCSAIIEAKARRGDFIADFKKPERNGAPGLGVYRFYICEAGVITAKDLPSGWGLLHADGSRVVEVVGPSGNMWPEHGNGVGDWQKFQHTPDLEAERAVLFSIARRLSEHKSVII